MSDLNSPNLPCYICTCVRLPSSADHELWTSYVSAPLVECEVVVVVELAGGEEGKVVARVRDQRVDNQARIPGDLLKE